jgi:hypothetical protein
MLEESLGIADRISDLWSIVTASRILGTMFRLEGKFEEAVFHFERCRQAAHTMGDRINQGIALSNLSNAANMLEDYPGSGRYAAQSLLIFSAVGDEIEIPFPVRMMAYSALHAGDLPRARVLARESLLGNHALASRIGEVGCLVVFARCALLENDAKSAVALLSLVENQAEAGGIPMMEPDVKALKEGLKIARKKLGKAAFDAAYRDGQKTSLEESVQSFGG